MELAARIAAWRSKQGLTQEAFGRAVGVTGVSVCYWETGVCEPSRETQERMAHFLGISRQELLFGAVPEPSSEADDGE